MSHQPDGQNRILLALISCASERGWISCNYCCRWPKSQTATTWREAARGLTPWRLQQRCPWWRREKRAYRGREDPTRQELHFQTPLSLPGESTRPSRKWSPPPGLVAEPQVSHDVLQRFENHHSLRRLQLWKYCFLLFSGYCSSRNLVRSIKK